MDANIYKYRVDLDDNSIRHLPLDDDAIGVLLTKKQKEIVLDAIKFYRTKGEHKDKYVEDVIRLLIDVFTSRW